MPRVRLAGLDAAAALPPAPPATGRMRRPRLTRRKQSRRPGAAGTGAAAAPGRPARRRSPSTTADEATILAHVAQHLTVFRFDANPHIIVLDFPTLRMQGEMLNRVASLIEKAGLPHDRVLTDAELDAAIRERGDTMETYYYGHDYRADALARFFATRRPPARRIGSRGSSGSAPWCASWDGSRPARSAR